MNGRTLDGAARRLRCALGPRERCVEIRDVDDAEPADHLLAVDEGPVGGNCRSVLPGDYGCGARGVESAAEHPRAFGLELTTDFGDVSHDRLKLVGTRRRCVRRVADGHEIASHSGRSPLCWVRPAVVPTTTSNTIVSNRHTTPCRMSYGAPVLVLALVEQRGESGQPEQVWFEPAGDVVDQAVGADVQRLELEGFPLAPFA